MIVPVTLVIMVFAKMASTAMTVFANLASQASLLELRQNISCKKNVTENNKICV